MRKPGINTNTDSRAKSTALIRQMAMSGPILNCMNIMAIRPPMVVRLLEPISGMPLLKAAMTASRMGSCCRSSLYRLHRMTA